MFVVSVKTGRLVAFDTRSREPVADLTICRGAGIFMDPIAQNAVISCTPDNRVAFVSLALPHLVREVALPRPDGVAISVRSRR